MENQIAPEQHQSANRVLMIRPSAFGYHQQAASSNAFMRKPAGEIKEIAAQAQMEFDGLARALRDSGVDVLVLNDSRGLPDCLFPNNWLSWHTPVDGSPMVVTYPMLDQLRRAERSPEMLGLICTHLNAEPRHLDISGLEDDHEYLEGTGSMVLDRIQGVAMACISPRTTQLALESWCDETGYTAMAFEAVDTDGATIYHTNVIMSVGDRLAVVCSQCIVDAEDRARVLSVLKADGRQVIQITLAQMKAFCGNILELVDSQGRPVLAMSTRAYEAFTTDQKRILTEAGTIVHVPIPTIEDVGGGGVRCMIAELGRG